MTISLKVAVVTGGDRGVGFEIVRLFCSKFTGDVYLTSLDDSQARCAIQTLTEQYQLSPKYHSLDIRDKSSIERLRNHLLVNYGGLDVLVNADAIAYKSGSSLPQLEQAINVIDHNYYGTIDVFDTLFPILRSGAMVINVSSCRGMLQRVPGHDLRDLLASDLDRTQVNQIADMYLDSVRDNVSQDHGWPRSPYAVSKLLVTILTRVIQNELEEKGGHGCDIVVKCCYSIKQAV